MGSAFPSQAVMASDFAIAQFRFLERLLLVHGHWCYRRISMMVNHASIAIKYARVQLFREKINKNHLSRSHLHHFFPWMQICYFFYKNIVFGFTLFWFEAYSSFSGQAAYNDWYMSFYNVFFTSLPVIALGVFDQDVSAKKCIKVCSQFNILSNEFIRGKMSKEKPRMKCVYM